ncbi:MAG: carbohydrate binding domain-containing protein [bacterium]|nr:carbohydrate binding domain-containing protein [bacterium]
MRKDLFILMVLTGLMFLIGCGKSVPDQMGIFSETYTNYSLHLKSLNPPDALGGYMGTWQSENKNPAVVTEDTTIVQEGKKSLKVSVGKGPWGGGMWIQFGFDKSESPVKVSTDLSGYKDGSLVFWVKTKTDMLIKLESEKGGESKKTLSMYNIPTDDTWQKVVIPMKDFTAVGGIDLKKVNVVFGSHFVVPQSTSVFWLDNIYITKTKE